MVRQRSAKPLSAGSIPAVASTFPIPPDFSFRATVESHGWLQLAPFRWSSEEQVLRRVEALPGGRAGLEIRSDGGNLHVTGAAPGPELDRRIRRMFQLHVDLTEFHELAGRVDSHSWVRKARFGRLLCGSTLWEDAVKIIATTNTTWRQTIRMTSLLVEKCGKGGAFPTPRDVIRFSEADLQRQCRLGYRARTIRALAEGLVSGEIDLARVSDPAQATDQLFRSYRTLPGIGPYGAAHLLAMDGRHDFIAVDSEFRRFVRETYHGGRRVKDTTLLRRYARWGRWKYLAYWSELWRSVAGGLLGERARDI